MTPIHVAVTGVGNPLGQNILKALQMSSLPLRIYGLDANPMSAGFASVDVPVVCARANAPGFVTEFVDFLRREDIRIVFFGTEAEPNHLAAGKEQIEAETCAHLMITDRSILAVADDKYETSEALKRAGIAHPASARSEDVQSVTNLAAQVGFPLIMKPRCGSAARGLARIDGPNQLAGLPQGYVVQECLLPDNAEYTVGVYRGRDGRIVASTVLRRDLDFGLTYRGWISPHPEIEAYANSVADALGGSAAINVQLRLTKRGPVCFEVNPRFSSTTPVRAYFGVNEPELAIREYVFGEQLSPVTARSGVVMREWREIYLEVDQADALASRARAAWRGDPWRGDP